MHGHSFGFDPLFIGKHYMPLQFTLVKQSPVIYFSQSQTHAQPRSTIGQCLLYSLSHTAVSLVLYILHLYMWQFYPLQLGPVVFFLPPTVADTVLALYGGNI